MTKAEFKNLSAAARRWYYECDENPGTFHHMDDGCDCND